jgi:hypothetical protein
MNKCLKKNHDYNPLSLNYAGKMTLQQQISVLISCKNIAAVWKQVYFHYRTNGKEIPAVGLYKK